MTSRNTTAMRPLRFLAGALLVLAASCRSSGSGADVPCTCGTHEADILGCAHAKCLAGHNNPENPDCVCGTLSIPK